LTNAKQEAAMRTVAAVVVLALIVASSCSRASAQFPVPQPEAESSSSGRPLTDLEYRRQQAETRRQARRAAERASWARLAAVPKVDDEKRAGGLLRMANTFGTMQRWELRDKWLAKVVDELPTTDAAKLARFELGR
jgi:hypothetical protein